MEQRNSRIFAKNIWWTEQNLDSIWKEFLALHCHNSVKGYVIEASCAKDGKVHVIGFDTTYVFRSEFCMDIGDCECIVIEFDKI